MIYNYLFKKNKYINYKDMSIIKNKTQIYIDLKEA